MGWQYQKPIILNEDTICFGCDKFIKKGEEVFKTSRYPTIKLVYCHLLCKLLVSHKIRMERTKYMTTEKKNILKELEEARKGTQCLSDRVLNYMQLLFKKFELDKESKEYAIEMYKDLRVDGFFGMSGNPRAHAGAIVYISAVKNGCIQVTQQKVAEYVALNVPVITKSYRSMLIKIRKKEAIKNEI